MEDTLSQQKIIENLRMDNKLNILIYETLESTSIEAKNMENKINNTIIIANSQTGGKGRLNRSFYSPANSGIYMSILLRPNLSADKSMLITTATAVAVCKAIENIFDLKPQIKWVNDILINGKKVCGILAEGSIDYKAGLLDYIIIGIGVNFLTSNFPKELKNAGGLIDSTKVTRNELIAEILNCFFYIYKDIENENIITEYKRRSVVLDKEIEIISLDKKEKAFALSIDNKGGLIVRLEDGSIKTLSTGEVSIRGEFYSD